jgi:hypothetical protein
MKATVQDGDITIQGSFSRKFLTIISSLRGGKMWSKGDNSIRCPLSPYNVDVLNKSGFSIEWEDIQGLLERMGAPIYIGNFTTIMLPFNLGHEKRAPRVILKCQYKLTLVNLEYVRYYDGGGTRSIQVKSLKKKRVLGHIIPTGYLQKYYDICFNHEDNYVDGFADHLIQLLRRFAETPMAVIKDSELNTGFCCFCDELKDSHHGPICEWYLGGASKRREDDDSRQKPKQESITKKGMELREWLEPLEPDIKLTKKGHSRVIVTDSVAPFPGPIRRRVVTKQLTEFIERAKNAAPPISWPRKLKPTQTNNDK